MNFNWDIRTMWAFGKSIINKLNEPNKRNT